MSSNAITADGELVNIDGNGNRVAALIYGVSPLDFVADFIPFGLVDDIAIISWALNRLSDELLRYRQWREGAGEEVKS